MNTSILILLPFFDTYLVPCWELPSLGEMRASNMVATKPMEFVAFTTRHMCRVYPSAYRIDSSNYNPQPMWNCGCQLGKYWI